MYGFYPYTLKEVKTGQGVVGAAAPACLGEHGCSASTVAAVFRSCRLSTCCDAALYVLVLAKASAGAFCYVESGEVALGGIVSAIAARLGLGAAQSWSAEEAIAAWGRSLAMLSLGSNSRVRGRAAAELGGSSARRSAVDWIANEMV